MVCLTSLPVWLGPEWVPEARRGAPHDVWWRLAHATTEELAATTGPLSDAIGWLHMGVPVSKPAVTEHTI